jgi:transmembrane protein EpsG
MAILWTNLFVVFIFSFFARYFSTPVLSTSTAVVIRPNRLLMIGTMLSLVIVSGLRSNIGDTFFYKHAYIINNYSWDFILSGSDIGFGILQMFLKKISDDPQILIFTTALITNILITFVLYKYSRIFELSIYVYITGGLFLVSMNGMRQVLSAAIIFTATKFLINGSWKRYILVVVIASFIHQSALILIPIYFLVRYKAWTKATFILLALSVVIVLGYNQFSSILFSAIEDTQYGHYSNFTEGGANIIRVLVDSVPIVIAYFGRDKLRQIFPNSDYIVNMSIIGFVFMIISTQNWIFARFSIYFSLYELILVSWIVKVFREKDQRFVYFCIIICYFFYHFYENVISLNIDYKSDYLNFFS